MRPVVSAEEMQVCDKSAIRSYGIPSLVLMENAGAGVARWVEERFGPVQGTSIGIFCGKGNNGGDGLVAARHLANSGARVSVYFFKGSQKGDAAGNAAILAKIRKSRPENITVTPASSPALSSFRPDLILDAIFGTGFSGSVKPEYARVIHWINEQPVPRIAIDIPSGVNGSTGEVGNIAVRATATLTLGALKRGLICNAGRDHAGEVTVLDIGIPRAVFEELRVPTCISEHNDIRTLLPGRPSTAHKYSVGKVFLLAGSRGYTGAAALAASAALRAGAGAVVLGTPDSVYKILARKLTEVIVEPLPSTIEGSLAASGLESILKRIAWADTAVIGPGLSRQEETSGLVRTILEKAKGRILLDADALNAVGDRIGLLKTKNTTLVLTPHTGEFSGMTGIASKDIEAARIDHAREFAKKSNSVIVLKGAPTAIAHPDGRVILNPTGNPGMATLGSGDVLSGIIAALWAQGAGTFDACTAGVYVHGLSGDHAATKLGQRSIVARDLIEFLPEAFLTIEREH